MGDDDIASAELPKPRPYIFEKRGGLERFVGDVVLRARLRCDRDAGLYVLAELINDFSVANPDCGNLDDLGAGDVFVRRLGIDGGEVTEVVGKVAAANEL